MATSSEGLIALQDLPEGSTHYQLQTLQSMH
jgi:hypothetical protein